MRKMQNQTTQQTRTHAQAGSSKVESNEKVTSERDKKTYRNPQELSEKKKVKHVSR